MDKIKIKDLMKDQEMNGEDREKILEEGKNTDFHKALLLLFSIYCEHGNIRATCCFC